MKTKHGLLMGVAMLGAFAANLVFADGGLPGPRPDVIGPTPGVLAPLHKTYHLNASELATEVDRLIGAMQMKLNNHQTQSSKIVVGGFTIPFNIPRTTIDIDCGTWCPDLGDGHFYVNDVNKSRGDFFARSGYFELALEFEDSGREVKGYHSVLGDNGMPDFQLDRPRLKVRATPVLVGGKVTLTFSAANLTADIQSTGGCNIGGIDVCNKIFGTDRKIEKGVELAAQNALNSPLVQNALKLAVSQYLSSRGITQQVIGVRLVGYDLQVTVNQ